VVNCLSAGSDRSYVQLWIFRSRHLDDGNAPHGRGDQINTAIPLHNEELCGGFDQAGELRVVRDVFHHTIAPIKLARRFTLHDN
jgi:hypothetical protein